jgi:hypothetical protein
MKYLLISAASPAAGIDVVTRIQVIPVRDLGLRTWITRFYTLPQRRD